MIKYFVSLHPPTHPCGPPTPRFSNVKNSPPPFSMIKEGEPWLNKARERRRPGKGVHLSWNKCLKRKEGGGRFVVSKRGFAWLLSTFPTAMPHHIHTRGWGQGEKIPSSSAFRTRPRRNYHNTLSPSSSFFSPKKEGRNPPWLFCASSSFSTRLAFFSLFFPCSFFFWQSVAIPPLLLLLHPPPVNVDSHDWMTPPSPPPLSPPRFVPRP